MEKFGTTNNDLVLPFLKNGYSAFWMDLGILSQIVLMGIRDLFQDQLKFCVLQKDHLS